MNFISQLFWSHLKISVNEWSHSCPLTSNMDIDPIPNFDQKASPTSGDMRIIVQPTVKSFTPLLEQFQTNPSGFLNKVSPWLHRTYS